MSPEPHLELVKEEGRPPDANSMTEGENVSMQAILDRQIEATAKLAQIEEALTSIRDHLKKLNGDTAKSVDRIGVLELHPSTCEVRAVIGEVKTMLSVQEATRITREDEDKKWQERLKPFVWLLFMFMLGLILGHADLFKSVVPKVVGG